MSIPHIRDLMKQHAARLIADRCEGFTPGPWYQTEDEDYTYVFADRDGKQYTIATADDGWLECGANAALIAAAPELLRIATEQAHELMELKHSMSKRLDKLEKQAGALEKQAGVTV